MSSKPVIVEQQARSTEESKAAAERGAQAVVSLHDRHPEARERRLRRELVERATVRESWGRSWERDNVPTEVRGLFHRGTEWQPRA